MHVQHHYKISDGSAERVWTNLVFSQFSRFTCATLGDWSAPVGQIQNVPSVTGLLLQNFSIFRRSWAPDVCRLECVVYLCAGCAFCGLCPTVVHSGGESHAAGHVRGAAAEHCTQAPPLSPLGWETIARVFARLMLLLLHI